MHRNPKNTKHWRLSWSRYETFITFFKFRFSTWGERETQFFYADYSSIVSSQFTDSTNARAHSTVHNWTGLTQVQKSTCFVELQISTHCFYSKSLRIPAHHIPSLFPIWGFYCDICDCHTLPVRAWTPALNVYT